MTTADISIIILTYNRADILEQNLAGLAGLIGDVREIIVVDNSSNDETSDLVRDRFPEVRYLRNETNTGVAGRNRGLAEAAGAVVVTLDDDVLGLDGKALRQIAADFSDSPQLGALCFRVLHFETGKACNWCHHRKQEEDGLSRFATYEITEGAVAYRRSALDRAGTYWDGFFISHEGKDLAYRLMNAGFDVVYEGSISVVHHHAISGRTSWRRHYYDTRNTIWIAVRNMPVWYAIRFGTVALGAMLVYSARDGLVKYWFKAVWDGMRGIREVARHRTPWTSSTRSRIREIDRRRPGFWYKVRLRLFRRGVQI